MFTGILLARVDGANAAWMMVATGLVLLMVPGLALFYGGMVRAKHVLGMFMMNVYCMGVVPLLWVLAAYSLISGENSGGNSFIGGFDWLAFRDVEDPFQVITSMFGLTFAVITPALISGAVADRMKFWAWVFFVPLWVLLVYVPIGTWVWAGWLLENGSLDFAGGTVVHINAGAAGLAAALVLGRRRGWPHEAMKPHSLPFTVIGAGILWFGWFGFNAGSALAANEIALIAFYNTFIAAAAGMVGWLVIETIRDGKPTSLGAASGVVAGLVAITPAAGYVDGIVPIVFGLVAGVVCYLAIQLKYKLGYDDSLDVVGVHMVGGLIGSLMVGLFADAAVNPDALANAAGEGLLVSGEWGLLAWQAIASLAALAWSFVVTFVIAKVLDLVLGLRVAESDEEVGLDQSQHSESAYNLMDVA
ncbi:MAG: ammonium transporter [Acidimicrobiales bacterium]|nr:MAG: ammonium transporter [Acidimicrobiales bacterium]